MTLRSSGRSQLPNSKVYSKSTKDCKPKAQWRKMETNRVTTGVKYRPKYYEEPNPITLGIHPLLTEHDRFKSSYMKTHSPGTSKKSSPSKSNNSSGDSQMLSSYGANFVGEEPRIVIPRIPRPKSDWNFNFDKVEQEPVFSKALSTSLMVGSMTSKRSVPR
jgi:hypothetical protein